MNIPIRLLLAFVLLPPVAATAFEPFFDDNPLTRHAPEAPELTDLDIDMLALCGDWGAPVEADRFEALLLEPAHRAAVERIRTTLGARVYGPARDLEDFVSQLRRAWFEQQGFAHVFCGEPGIGRDLGGLHYAPRYRQAQQAGWAGYRPLRPDHRLRPLEKCRASYLRERIAPPIFNISIAFVNPKSPENAVKCLGGYHRLMDAERLLTAATAAFKQANRRVDGDATESCFFLTRFDGVEPHYGNLVISRRAIRTFYPLADARPYCRRDRHDPGACLCSRL